MYGAETPTQSTPAEVDLERKLQKLTTQPDEAGEFRLHPEEKQQVIDAVWVSSPRLGRPSSTRG